MASDLKSDIEAMYRFADTCDSLAELVPQLYGVLRRNKEALLGVTDSYRLTATDTGYQTAFALYNGEFHELSDTDTVPVDVTVSGAERNLLAVFQRKLNPMTGLLLHKLHVDGSKGALVKLASFL